MQHLASRSSGTAAHMAYTLVLVFGALFVQAASAQSTASPKADFTWRPNVGEYVTIDKVTFANSAEIREISFEDGAKYGCEFGATIGARAAGSKSFGGTAPCDSRAKIEAAWPSVKAAKVAIVSTNCGGTSCGHYSDYFVYLINGTGIKVLQVGTGYVGPEKKPTTFSFTFSGNDPQSSAITNFYNGAENNLGDLIASKRTLLKGKGYFDDAFKPEFVDLVGEHPERFLEDDTLRSALVTKMGPANFRNLRSSLSGPGTSSLINGRFVLMEACQKSNCDSVWGAVMIDGFTGDAASVVIQQDTAKVAQFSTRPLKSTTDSAWIQKLAAGDKRFISLDKGVISVRKMNGF